MPDPTIPKWLYQRPFAHRGLHGLKKGVVENSRRAFLEAIRQRYGIELDVQPASDGTAMVFHDRELDRLTDHKGMVAEKTAPELGQISLNDSQDVIEPLSDILKFVAGRVPVLVELKEDAGLHDELCQSVADTLARYRGNAAVMSFNPDMMQWFARRAPKIPRGLVAKDYPALVKVADKERKSRANLDSLDKVKPQFITYSVRALPSSVVERARKQGLPINCWTVRTRAERLLARQFCDTMTFEGFVA